MHMMLSKPLDTFSKLNLLKLQQLKLLDFFAGEY